MPKPTEMYPRAFVDRFWARVDKTSGCWIWKGALTRGYGELRHRQRPMKAHRVAWQLEHGPIPVGLGVLHHCDTPACVNPDHLFLGTQRDNMVDMNAKGRNGMVVHPELVLRGDRHYSRQHPEKVVRGSRHGLAKLTEADVIAIRVRHAAGNVNHVELGKEFGVWPSTIRRAINGETWGYLAT